MSDEETGRLGHNPPIWHRRRSDWPFIVWEGNPDGAASGRAYRRRWRAILAAWWASRYAQQDVWIEHRAIKPGDPS